MLRRLPMGRMLAVTPLVVIALVAAVMGARARVPDDQIAPGVHVGELDLGGKSLQDAKPLLEQWAKRKQSATVTLRFEQDSGIDKTWTPDAAKLGLGVNVDSTLDAAAKAGREDIAGQVSHMFSGPRTVQVPAVPTTDDARLKAYLKRQIAGDVNRKPKNAQFILIKGGGFSIHKDQPGRAVEVDTSAAAVKQAWAGYLAARHASAATASHRTAETASGATTDRSAQSNDATTTAQPPAAQSWPLPPRLPRSPPKR